MKRILPILLVLLLVLAIPISADTSSIHDYSGLLASHEVKALDTFANQAGAKGLTTVVLTMDALPDSDAESYAHRWLSQNYRNQDAILILVSMSERDWAIVAQNTAADAITGRDIDDIADQVVPCLSGEEYYEAFRLFIQLSSQEYADYLAGTDNDVDAELILTRLGIALLIGAIIALIVLLILRHNMNSARAQAGARNYMVAGSYDLLRCHDFYLYSHTTRVRKAENNSGSSRGGGSRSGRSGKF